jgi:serine/threonine protein kinase
MKRVDPGRKTPPDRRFGRYCLVERLGEGRQGQVWKAIQLEPVVETVALKLLSPTLAHDPKRLAQFHREAEVGAQLESPSLLQTYEYGEVNGIPYMTMPLVNGVSLDQVIIQMTPGDAAPAWDLWGWWSRLNEETYIASMVRVIIRIARALAVAHANQVVHRDVKPANILMDRDREDRVYLSDFGLSRDLDGPPPLTPLYGTGTPLYMAPEKLTACPSNDVLCDVYALGVTLFEAVTRVHPLTVPAGLAPSDWVGYIAVATPSTPRAVSPRVSQALEAVILKAMERNPARRYGSASVLADDLERLSPGKLVAASGRPH